MDAALSCPQCGRSLKVPLTALGKTIKCPCGHAFVAERPAAGDTPAVFVLDCPECGAAARIPETARGKRVKCRKCAAIFPVPLGPPPAEEPAAPREAEPRAAPEPQEEEAAPPPRREKRRDRDEEDYEDEPRWRPKKPKARAKGRGGLDAIGVGVITVVMVYFLVLTMVATGALDRKKDAARLPGPGGFNPGPGPGIIPGPGPDLDPRVGLNFDKAEATGFATPQEALRGYVKAVVELDVPVYKKILGKTSLGLDDFNWKIRLAKMDHPGRDDAFLARAALNDRRMQWLDIDCRVLPPRADGPNGATAYFVWTARVKGKPEVSYWSLHFQERGGVWYLASDASWGIDDGGKKPDIPAGELRPVIPADAVLTPLDYHLLAEENLPTPEEAKKLLEKMRLVPAWDADGKIVAWKNFPELGSRALQCAYPLLSPQFRKLETFAEWLGDPDLEKLSRLTGLEELNLYGQRPQFTDQGVAHLRNLTGLKRLHLTCSLVTEGGYAFLKPLTRLEAVTVFGRLTDKALANLAGATRLRWLNLHRNRVVGPGLVHLKNATGLESLNLRENRLTGEGLQLLAALPVREAFLDQNAITDDGLKNLAGWKAVEQLDLSGNRISDAGLAHLQTLKNIRDLNLSGNDIRGPGLAHLKALPVLETVHLRDNPLTEAALEHLAQVPKLRRVFLSESASLSPAALAKLRKAVPEVEVSK